MASAVNARLRALRDAQTAGPAAGSKRDASDAALDDATLEKIHADGKRRVALADEKVALAQQAYDLVDQHIARLDRDLRAFDAALAEKEAAQAAAEGIVFPKSGVGGPGVANAARTAIGDGGGAAFGDGGGDAGTALPGMALGPGVGVQHPLAAPADPNEPKYCVCNRVSFGEMIACENEACAVEWFHFACVGLSTDAKIKGKWFCATCSADIKRQKKLEKKREEAKDADKPGRK